MFIIPPINAECPIILRSDVSYATSSILTVHVFPISGLSRFSVRSVDAATCLELDANVAHAAGFTVLLTTARLCNLAMIKMFMRELHLAVGGLPNMMEAHPQTNVLIAALCFLKMKGIT
jgi:hypothetical protein